MGATTTHGLPWPETSGLVKDGAADIRGLAETVDARLGGRYGRAFRGAVPKAVDTGTTTDIGLTRDPAVSSPEFTWVEGGGLLYTGPACVSVAYGFLEWAANVDGYRRLIIALNGSADIVAQLDPDAGGQSTKQSSSGVMTLADGDLVELQGRQTSGVTIDVTAAEIRVVVIGYLP